MTLAGALLAGVDRAFVPLDRWRRALYRVGAPWLGPWIRDRQVRIGLHGLTVAVGSFVLSLLAPLVMLALGPLLLGVPHLLADVRYLVARPGLHRRRGAWLVGALVVASSVFMDLRWGVGGVVLAVVLAQGRWHRRMLGLGVAAAALVSLFLWSGSATLSIGHLHNAVAVVLWLLLGSALHGTPWMARWARLATVVPVGLFGTALLLGAGEGWTGPALGPALRYHAQTLAPVSDPDLAVRWVRFFAFAQAVHYGLWLRVVPEECRHRPAPRSWRASWKALRSDLGDRLLAAFTLVTVGLAVWGCFDVIAARAGYLRLALFHGPLELVVLGLVLVEGRAVLRPGGHP